jgi:O-antigen ligase
MELPIERLQRWTSWAGGPWILAAVVAVQLIAVVVFAMKPMAAVALVVAVAGAIVVLDRPVLGVGLLLAARLLSTGATVFVRVGRMGLGPFEPVLVLCLVALVFHAALNNTRLWRNWPWRAPLLGFMAWTFLSLFWSVNPRDGLSDLLPLFIVLANAMVILAFVRTWRNFKLMLWFWVGASVAVGVLTLALDAAGIATTDVTFQAAAGGGRETGLGQQPNWYAMHLMFIIHTAFGMALIERKRWVRVGLVVAGFFVFVMMLKSGSRGGAYATLIGGVLAALAHPLFRKWFVRISAVAAAVFLVGIAFDIGDTAKAFSRIASNLTLSQNYRQLNWLTCLEMFRDTGGLGIGAGGYEDLLPSYNNYVAQSLYTYPHGIAWELIAHHGVVGLGLLVWLIARIVGMARRLVVMARGTEAEVFAWTMPAAMLGYFAWSWVEFTLTEKPFWEFLSLYTALYLIVVRMKSEGQAIDSWSLGVREGEGA